VHIDYFLKIFKENSLKDAIVWNNLTYSYDWLLKRYYHWENKIKKNLIKSGTVVVIEADFSPNSIALLLLLIEKNTIIVPISDTVRNKNEFIDISEGEVIIQIGKNDKVNINRISNHSDNQIYKKLKARQHPGLVLFSSGSTGKSKASVHDITYLLEKFKTRRHTFTTITFLLYDHIGGFNTLFYTLSNAGKIVAPIKRTASSILSLIEQHAVELLPTSPTFLNLILISEEYKKFNLSSLKIITYGTEPMPDTTLKKLNKIFPDIKFTQTYGLSEVGILRSKSKSSNSLWVKIGGEDYKTRVVDGMLEIKSKSSMLGYLNAPSPFTDDGWFKTGDSVEVDGEYIKILGRKSEIINVGGEKVYPQEVENIILKIPLVKDVFIYKESNQIIGNIVCADVLLNSVTENRDQIRKDIKSFCLKNLEPYKVPIKINFVQNQVHSSRYKKKRN
jgi:long-chain acyl-CoA synthetase